MLQSFRTMLGRLQEMWKSFKPRHLWLGVFALALAGTLLFVEPTYAQQGIATGIGDWLIRQVAKIMLVVASLSIGLSIFFLRFFIMIASYNNYIDVSVVQLGWVMVRDVANMFFVVALLLIAFGTILGLEEYEWKKNLAKLILSAILINFSNLIAQLCIDIAHVFTITFLNAISATAGGNLVNMFKLDQILALTAAQDPSGLDVEVLAAVLPAMLFAIMAAAAIGSYVVVMAARVVALWALIVISPLAFILGVIPQTKSYADKWWAEFSKYVIVAPIMVFFLWLSFATVGLGNIATEIEAGLPANVKTSGAEAQFGVQRLSMSKVTTWENMANFLIAFAFLMYGIKATQETGTLGSGMIGSAVDFGKKVATIASGYTAGRWLVGKGKDAGWAGTKWTADALAGDYYERAKLKLSKIPKGYENWKTMGPQWERKKIDMATDQKVADDYQLSLEEQKAGFTVEQREDGKYKVAGLTEVEKLLKYKIVEQRDENGNLKKDENGNIMRQKVRAGNVYNIKTDEQGNVIYKKNKDGTFAKDDNGNRIAEGMDKPVYESWLQERKHKRYTKLLSARKRVEKIENDTKLNEEIADKGIEAVPEHWLSSKNKESMGKEYDRVKKGRLKRMNARSAAKTEEYELEGDLSEADSYRYKDGRYQTERGTVAEQIAGHQGRAAAFKSQLDEIDTLARKKFLDSKDGKKSFEGKIKADLEVKATNAAISNLEAGLTNNVALGNLQATKEQNAKIDKYRTELENASRNSSPEEFYDKQEKLLREMMGEGLVSNDEYDEISKNQRINRAMAGHSDKSKEEALAELVREGVISEKDRSKIAKDMGNTRELGYTFPKDRENVFQRTIVDEKGAHLKSEKLSTLQKEEEAVFAQGAHGKEEAREIAVLKEKTLAAEGKIKRTDETGKAAVADTIPRDGDSAELRAQKEAYARARAEKIAAEKQAHTESEKVSTLEKEAERDYAKTDHGLDELRAEEILKERTARAEAEIKMETAEAKKEVARDSEEFKEAMEARIKAEQQAGVRESAAQRFAKEAEAAYLAGEGKGESRQDAIVKEQIAAAEAKIKKEQALSKQDVSTGGTFEAANRARIEAEKQAHTASEEVSTIEKERERDYALSDHGKDELEREEILRERTAAAEGEIKQQAAEAKRVMAAGDDEFIEAQKRRIAAERAASSRESQAQRFEKERGAEYAEGAGKADISKEQLAKEQIAAADARVKQQESAAKTRLSQRDDTFQAAQAARIAADISTKDSEGKSKVVEAELVKNVSRDMAGVLRSTAQSGLQTKAAEDEAKELEAVAKAEAALTESEALLRSQKAQIKAKDADATTKEQEALANSLAGKELKGVLKSTANKDLKASVWQADFKQRESKAKLEARKESPAELERLKRQEVATQALEVESKQLESEAGKRMAEQLKNVFARINFSEQATKAAEDFVKNIKEDDLQKKFSDASEEMKKWVNLSTEQLQAKIREVTLASHNTSLGAYVAALGQAQLLKTTQETGGITRRQAEDAASDAFVSKARYGITTASTAYSDYSDTKLKDYKKLERAAAMKKATDVLAFLMHKKQTEGKLDLDQTAEMYAASNYLQSEAWNDDQAGYIYTMLEKLQQHQVDVKNGGKGLMDAEQENQWKTMAANFSKLGWVEENVVDKDGNFILESKTDENGKETYQTKHIAKKYTRQKAADMQNLAITGGDVELLQAHHLISEELDRNALAVEEARSNVRVEVIQRALAPDSKYAAQIQQRREEMRGDIEEEATQKNLTGTDRENYINKRIESVEMEAAAEAAAKEIEEESNRVAQGIKKNYWQIANSILPKAGVDGIKNSGQLKERYERHGDMLQDATKGYKAYAHNNGHEKLGGNQGFDEDADTYRFMTLREAQAEIRADRVKMKARQLLNTDQYHSNGGELDLDTGILDDFLEDVLNLTIGKMNKLIEFTDIPERSLKGAFYIHKNEKAKVVKGKGRKGADGQTELPENMKVAVLGGATAVEKFKADGDVEQEDQMRHMLTRGVLPALMSGHIGWSMAAAKLYGHVKEQEAQTGIINMEIGDRVFRNTKEVADYILEQIKKVGANKYLAGSKYTHDVRRVTETLRQIAESDVDVSSPSSDDDDAAANQGNG